MRLSNPLSLSPPRDVVSAHGQLVRLSDPLSLPPGTPSRPTVSSCGSLSDAAGGDSQLLVLVSDKQARVLATPSHSCLCKLQITETSFVVRAEIISLKGGRGAGPAGGTESERCGGGGGLVCSVGS